MNSQPQLTVKIKSFPESDGKRNWTAMFVRTEPGWDGLVGSAGGVVVACGEYWNRVAYVAERARFLLGERPDEPWILDYSEDITTPENWKGERGRPKHKAAAAAVQSNSKLPMRKTSTSKEKINRRRLALEKLDKIDPNLRKDLGL